MFNVEPGGVIEAINWSRDQLTAERSVIILDESNQTVWLWHGSKQGLVARRTALRQAESLKGHGYTVGKSILGRDIRTIKEIDQRKIGRDPETDEIYTKFDNLLNRDFKELDDHVVTFELAEIESKIVKPPIKTIIESKTKPIAESKPIAETKSIAESKPIEETKPVEKVMKQFPTEYINEYDLDLESKPSLEQKVEIKPKDEPKPAAAIKIAEPQRHVSPSRTNLDIKAKLGFILVSILDHYDDIWVSKKEDGSYAVEYMDGPICQFSIKEGSKISFTADSFKGISTNIKTEIQRLFVELSKLL
jgi:hypothetical protein